MPLQDWNAGRLDDLRALVDANDSRLDNVEKAVDHLQRDQTAIATRGDRRRDRSWLLGVALTAAITSPIISVVLGHALYH